MEGLIIHHPMTMTELGISVPLSCLFRLMNAAMLPPQNE